MPLSSCSDRTHARQEHGRDPIQPGDVVHAGRNPRSRFEVIAVHAATAWVRDVRTGADQLAVLSRCRKIEPLAAT